MRKNVITEVISSLFIILFVYASLSKIMDFQKFETQLGQSPMLTYYAGAIAVVIPSIEIIISVMLSLNRYRLAGLYLSFTLMTLFSAYIIAITQFSDYVPCSCGGILQKMGWTTHLIFNFVFMALAVLAIVFEKRMLLKGSATVSVN